MLASRTTFLVKQGCMEKALELLKTEIDRVKPENVDMRIYTPKISPHVLVLEDVWESLEEHDKFWAEYFATPEAAALLDKWSELIERRVGDELWNLTECG